MELRPRFSDPGITDQVTTTGSAGQWIGPDYDHESRDHQDRFHDRPKLKSTHSATLSTMHLRGANLGTTEGRPDRSRSDLCLRDGERRVYVSSQRPW